MQKQYVTYKSIYIFIYSTFEAYLQFIFTDKKGGKKAPNEDIMSNTAVPLSKRCFVLRGKPGGRIIARDLQADAEIEHLL